MNISISPIGTGLIIIFVSNCLISLGKSDRMKKCYIILSSILSAAGITGIILISPQFISRLNKNADIRHFDSAFVSWAITKFNHFAVVSIILTCLSIIFLLYGLLANKKNKSGFIWDSLSAFVAVIMIIVFFAGILYSVGAINKLFDIGFYIGVLSICEIFALHIPMVAKRILTLSTSNSGSSRI